MNSTLPPQQRLDHLNSQFLNARSPYSKPEAYAYNANAIAWFCQKKPERIEKFFKVANKFLEILVKVQLTADACLTALAASFKNIADVLESLRFINVLKIFLTPENSRYFLFDPTISFRKKSDRVLLLGHSVCKTLKNLNKWKMIDLGTIAKCKIGPHLTCFHLITDSLMIASSIFGLWENSFSFQENYASLKECSRKITKWEARPLSLSAIQTGDQKAIKKFQTRCEAKIKQISQQIALRRQELLDPKFANDSGAIQEIKTLEKKLNKNENRLQKLNSGDYIGFVKELFEKKIINKIKYFKNEKKARFKKFSLDVARVASSASKICVIALALLFTAINISSTIPVIVLLACGIIADSIGLTKIYIEKGPSLLNRKSRTVSWESFRGNRH